VSLSIVEYAANFGDEETEQTIAERERLRKLASYLPDNANTGNK